MRDTILRGTAIVDGRAVRRVDDGGGRFVPRTMLPEVLRGDFAFTSQALGASQPEPAA